VVEKPTVFIGSSSESLRVARQFQIALEREAPCEVRVWDQGTFLAGLYAMESLRADAQAADFAVMVLTPDDIVESRDRVALAPRDNVVFELGLFMGALGVGRVFMLAPSGAGLKLPSDLDGINRLSPYDPHRGDGNLLAALTAAAADAHRAMARLGRRPLARQGTVDVSTTPENARPPSSPTDRRGVDTELAHISRSAVAQGWRVAATSTTFRLWNPKGRRFTFVIADDPTEARQALYRFSSELRASGLRVNLRARRRPVV